jgi:hypothetical protein
MKKNIYLSTIIRGAPIEEGGEIIKIDWESKKILKRHYIVPKEPKVVDPNPRGGSRGGRGIIKYENKILVASYHTIHVFDLDLNPIKDIKNNLFVGIHEIKKVDSYIYVTSTKIDTIVKIDYEGNTINYWSARDNYEVQRLFKVSPLNITDQRDNREKFMGEQLIEKDKNHLHLNAVSANQNEVYLTFNAKGAIFGLPDNKVLYSNDNIKGFHNLEKLDKNKFLICNSKFKELKIINKNGIEGEALNILKFNILKFYYYKFWIIYFIKYYMKFKEKISQPFFLRGLDVLNDQQKAFAGVSPLGVIEVDLNTMLPSDFKFFSNDITHCVHGLLVDFY